MGKARLDLGVGEGGINLPGLGQLFGTFLISLHLLPKSDGI